MNEDGHQKSEFLLSFPIVLLCCLFPLFSVVCWKFMFSGFVAEMGLDWAQLNCPQAASYAFRLPGCLQASSSLDLSLSLSLSLAYISLLCKSHMYIGYFLLPICIHSFSLSLLLKDISIFPACSVSQLVSVSDHWVLTAMTPWSVRLREYGHSLGTALPGTVRPLFYSRQFWCSTAAELHPGFLISMSVCTSLALISPFDHWLQFCRDSDVFCI